VIGLYAIIDLPHAGGVEPQQVLRAALGDRLRGGTHGAGAVQLRAKGASTGERVELLRQFGPLCLDAGATLWVNDDVAAAVAGVSGVTGVHLGVEDPGWEEPAAVRRAVANAALGVGLSTHDLAQVRAAARAGADYLGFGPVAPTRSKQRPDPVVGFAGLADACRVASRPVVAIGGLDLDGVRRAAEAGAAGAAVIAALVAADPTRIRDRAEALAHAFAEGAAPLELDAVAARIPVLPRAVLEGLADAADDLGVLASLRLPARFAPRRLRERVLYRPSDVLDLEWALGRDPQQSWEDWLQTGRAAGTSDLVALRPRDRPARGP
jgi:thiamine-phosphate pyrophosphorylase